MIEKLLTNYCYDLSIAKLAVGDKIKMHALGDGANMAYEGSSGTIIQIRDGSISIHIIDGPYKNKDTYFNVDSSHWGFEILPGEWDF